MRIEQDTEVRHLYEQPDRKCNRTESRLVAAARNGEHRLGALDRTVFVEEGLDCCFEKLTHL